ncbi:MAG: dethiobiotin synthase [Bacteroidota bacterium]|nr:dethiobiotin synthase [Bacteroidota bacterium]
MKPIFVTGTGTNVGKTVVSAVLTEALEADYWKPIQAGFEDGTDALRVGALLTNKISFIHPELYTLEIPASPHIAAAAEGKLIRAADIVSHLPKTSNRLIIEGAGGLMVPINKSQTMLTLIKKLKAQVIIVSKNELGSINHSLLTAMALKKEGAAVLGWIFNESFMNYEMEIAKWSHYPRIGSIRHLEPLNRETVKKEALKLRRQIKKYL